MSDYDLKLSVAGIGKLNKVLVDKNGNIIDGKHRLEIDPDWPKETLDHVDNPTKLALARLTSNFCRRKIDPQEVTDALIELVEKGVKPPEIADATGIGLSTIYKYLPQEQKNKQKVEAGTIGGQVLAAAYQKSALPVEQTVKTQDTSKPLIECERCHVNTSEPKQWHNHNLCPRCLERAEFNPEAYDGYFRYLERRKNHQVPPTIKSPPKPSDLDTWETRKARMSPQHSQFEMNVIEALNDKGVKGVVQNREFCLLNTVPDIYLPQKNLAIYLDGHVHNGKQDRDEELRGMLQKRYGLRVLSFPYEANSQKETERVVTEILKKVT